MATNLMENLRATKWLNLGIVVLTYGIMSCFHAVALAQDSAGIQSPSRATQYIDGKKFASGPSPWSGSGAINYSRSVINSDDSFFSESIGATLTISRKIFSNYTAGLTAGGVQEVGGFKETAINPTYFSLSRSLYKNASESFSVSLAGRLYAPTNQDSASHTSFQGAARISPSVRLSNKTIRWGESIELGASLPYRENFYQYDVNATGGRNVARTFIPSASISYSWHPKWALDLSGSNTISYDTFADRLDDAYAHTEAISYQADPSFSVSLGHTITDTTTQYDRVTSNVQVTDIALSQVFSEITYTF